MTKNKTMLQLIEIFLIEYDHIWPIIDINFPPYTCGKISMEYINDRNYHKYDFTKQRSVFELFRSDDRRCFSAICYMEKQKDYQADKYPVYYFDLANSTVEYVGNFRTYIQTITKHCMDLKKLDTMDYDNKSFRKELKEIYHRTNDFSKQILYKKYKLKPTQYHCDKYVKICQR